MSVTVTEKSVTEKSVKAKPVKAKPVKAKPVKAKPESAPVPEAPQIGLSGHDLSQKLGGGEVKDQSIYGLIAILNSDPNNPGLIKAGTQPTGRRGRPRVTWTAGPGLRAALDRVADLFSAE